MNNTVFTQALAGQRIAFTGKLLALPRHQLTRIIRDARGTITTSIWFTLPRTAGNIDHSTARLLRASTTGVPATSAIARAAAPATAPIVA